MKYRDLAVLPVLLCIASAVYTAGLPGEPGLPETAGARAAERDAKAAGQGAQGAGKQDERPAGPPPLVIDKNAPLLLEEPPKKDPGHAPGGPVANNTACYCCHVNYQEEPLAARHASANVGCVKCHGDSFAHRNDEDNVTPPDILYWPEKIQSSCMHCHKTHDAPAREVIARWQQRCRTKTDPGKIVCTDCHGEHRLKLRTICWGKKTRKLVVCPKGERAKPAADPTKPGRRPKKAPDQGSGPDSRRE